jgi:hypothetical protein
MKIRPVETELFHADGRTERQTDRQTYLSNLRVASRTFINAPQLIYPHISLSQKYLMYFSNEQCLYFLNKPSFNPNFPAAAIWLFYIVILCYTLDVQIWLFRNWDVGAWTLLRPAKSQIREHELHSGNIRLVVTGNVNIYRLDERKNKLG